MDRLQSVNGRALGMESHQKYVNQNQDRIEIEINISVLFVCFFTLIQKLNFKLEKKCFLLVYNWLICQFAPE